VGKECFGTGNRISFLVFPGDLPVRLNYHDFIFILLQFPVKNRKGQAEVDLIDLGKGLALFKKIGFYFFRDNPGGFGPNNDFHPSLGLPVRNNK
jgi:hypothetical protein